MAEESAKSSSQNSKSVSRSTFQVTIGNLLGLMVGFGSQIVIAWLFGTGEVMDAYFTALVVPVYLQAVLLGGLSFVFVPTFIREESSSNKDDAWALAGTFLWLIGGILAVIAIISALLAHHIIALSAPGLDQSKAELAANMLAILIFTVPINGLGSITVGIQHARGRFFWPAAAQAVGSTGNIVVLLLLYQTLGPLALAWGFLIAEILRGAVTLTPVVRHGWSRLLPLNDPRVREMGTLIAPFILFGLLTRCMPLVERYFASGLPDGELSYIGYATKISQIAMTVLGTGIATTILPVMSRAYVDDGLEGLTSKAEEGIRLSVAVALPVLATLSVVAVPMIATLYERGEFDRTATMGVAKIVMIVMFGEVFLRMLVNVIVRAFYVTKDTRTVPIIGALTTIVYIFLARILVDMGGYVGLAWAQPIQLLLAIAILMFLLIRKLKFFHLSRLGKHLALYAGVASITFAVAWLIAHLTATQPHMVQLAATFAGAGSIYIVLLFQFDRYAATSIFEMAGVLKIADRLNLPYGAKLHALFSPHKANQ